MGCAACFGYFDILCLVVCPAAAAPAPVPAGASCVCVIHLRFMIQFVDLLFLFSFLFSYFYVGSIRILISQTLSIAAGSYGLVYARHSPTFYCWVALTVLRSRLLCAFSPIEVTN